MQETAEKSEILQPKTSEMGEEARPMSERGQDGATSDAVFGPMKCPRCGQEQFCGCDSCKARHKEPITWLWADDYNFVCGNCGLKKSGDWWEKLAYDIKTDFFHREDDKPD